MLFNNRMDAVVALVFMAVVVMVLVASHPVDPDPLPPPPRGDDRDPLRRYRVRGGLRAIPSRLAG